MKTVLVILSLCLTTRWLCQAQDSRAATSSGLQPAYRAPESLTLGERTNQFTSLDQRFLELKTQYFLLSQLAQEHRKRAQEAPPSQPAKSQWESELAKELSDQASAVLAQLRSASQERLAFNQTHPNPAEPTSKTPAPSAPTGPNPDQLLFLGKLDEHLAAVQQQITETIEAGRLYMTELTTNKNSSEVYRLTSLLQENGHEVKRLQREAADLELRKLEFRALIGIDPGCGAVQQRIGARTVNR